MHFELKLRKCLSIPITEGDLKPKEVCEPCLKKINDFYNFIIICEATDFEFDKILYENSSKWYPKHEPIYETTSTSSGNTTVLYETPTEFYQTPQETSTAPAVTVQTSTASTNYYQTVIEIIKPEQVSNNAQDKIPEEDTNLKKPQPPPPPNTGKIKPFTCTVCNKQFMRRANLQMHVSNQHSTVRPFQCKVCEKQFSTKRELRVHNLLHTEQFRCTWCGHVFVARGKLERHIRTHTGERPYVCVKCDKAFSDKRNLDAHILTLHDNTDSTNLSLSMKKKPFECTKCHKTFRSKSHLNEHLQVHTMDQPFICEQCGKRFKWRANLILHMQAHSGIFYECTICKQKYTRSTQLKKHKERCHPNVKVEFKQEH
ncbi:gastrula zinc finger protein XlCGF8.2DB-like [Chrysoperla carnea]|uniref:gastrula zinc finger protein XlCGF8.2DB-like n=1 Tax=Chrysoperla carnea TaxID=189513 RepID=UPI001D08B0E2|nr:gastrula zinc finger protein XlCGF8.2DB-like [Chrysoperla carnea]